MLIRLHFMFHLALKVLYSLMFVYWFLCSGILSLQPAESPVCPIELQGFLCRSCLKDHHTDWWYIHKGSTNNRRTREPRCCDAATVITPGQLTHGRVDYLKVVRFFCNADLDHHTETTKKTSPRAIGRFGDLSRQAAFGKSCCTEYLPEKSKFDAAP